jgi:hypothetical protein
MTVADGGPSLSSPAHTPLPGTQLTEQPNVITAASACQHETQT